MRKLTLQDLLATGYEMYEEALFSTTGDPASEPIGVHKGRNVDRLDTMRLSKRMIHDHAKAGDIEWFEAFAADIKSRPFRLPRSLRRDVPKNENDPSAGTRPIDDPAEIKRLITLHVRKILEHRAEQMMTSGQYGGRPTWAIDNICKRSGSTAQDQLATALHQTIWNGFPICLALDLKDAFGRIPKQAAIKEFNRLGLDDEAARWLWRLVKIYAVDVRNRNKYHERIGRGIEQGNPLSSMTMNLVLAPIFTAIETSINVRAFSYLDDIYLMAPTADVAQKAFKIFKQVARSRGFKNVRRLWRPGDPTDTKLSRIIDTRLEMIPVLKTFEVDALGISLDLEKVTELRKKGYFQRKLTLNELRNISGCQSLTKGASRRRTPDIIRLARNNDSMEPSHPFPAEEQVGSNGSSGDLPVLILMDMHGDGGETDLTYIKGSYQGDIEGKKGPISNDLPCMRNSSESLYPCKHGRNDGHHEGGSNRYRGVHSHQRPNQGNRTGDLPIGDSPAKKRCDSQGRRNDVSAERHSCLSISFDEWKRMTEDKKAGNRFKGCLLDLRGLQPEGVSLPHLVNRLIKSVRIYRQATVLIDPAEAWTANSCLLGNYHDPVYHRESYELRPDGSVMVELCHRRHPKPKPKHSNHSPPPDSDLIVNRVRRTNHAMFIDEILFCFKGKRFRKLVSTETHNEVAGALSAIASILDRNPAATIAIRNIGLAGESRILTMEDGHIPPPLVTLNDRWKQLRRKYHWSEKDGYIVGRYISSSSSSKSQSG